MYPIRFHADYLREPRDRLTTFFRLILVIPWAIVAALFGIAAYVVVIVVWFALLILARYPQGMYDFVVQFMRLSARVNGFAYLLTDRFPPFHGDADASYPVRLEVDPPQERYSRAKVFFRIILLIPVIYVVSPLMSYVLSLAGAISWLAILFTGRQPAGIHNAIALGIAYQMRLNAYMLLLTDRYPAISDDEQAPGEQLLAAVGGGPAPLVGGMPTELPGPPVE